MHPGPSLPSGGQLVLLEARARPQKFRAAAEELSLTQSAVSHQPRILKNNKLVKFRREGKTVFYALDDDHVRSILKLGMEHLGD